MMSISLVSIGTVRGRFEEDEIPVLSGSSMLTLLDSEWFFVFGPAGSQVEALMQWIRDSWHYDLGKPKIGFIGYGATPFYEEQCDMAEAVVEQYPDKYEWLGAGTTPGGTMTSATEVKRLIDSDFILVGMPGPAVASFAGEARARGYENRLIGPLESFWSYWELIKRAVPSKDLDGILTGTYLPWWDDDVLFILELKEYAEKYRSPAEVEAAYLTTGHITGWAKGMILVDAVRRAVGKVGAENADELALRDALAETDMTVEGWGNPWKLRENVNTFAQTVRLYECKAAEDKWVAISDWITPPSLGG